MHKYLNRYIILKSAFQPTESIRNNCHFVMTKIVHARIPPEIKNGTSTTNVLILYSRGDFLVSNGSNYFFLSQMGQVSCFKWLP